MASRHQVSNGTCRPAALHQRLSQRIGREIVGSSRRSFGSLRWFLGFLYPITDGPGAPPGRLGGGFRVALKTTWVSRTPRSCLEGSPKPPRSRFEQGAFEAPQDLPSGGRRAPCKRETPSSRLDERLEGVSMRPWCNRHDAFSRIIIIDMNDYWKMRLGRHRLNSDSVKAKEAEPEVKDFRYSDTMSYYLSCTDM
ncbi:hypothetical protein MJO28_015991 [Puccinia striiformis f. sp. tritici]|uniref:Uncharacterized protein n=1 Tax=Puccinia striiformis f. sp. tritici TaxID=168172 RepID=A0ACC0DRC6_9BASI|nr:hypothetical protein MJO28_015991 [Puccinia striiformis f. sp. tritici]